MGIVAPPTTFNAHLRLAPSGEYVLFFRGGEKNGKPVPANWTKDVCAGVSESEWETMVKAGSYISPEDILDPIGNFVAHSSAMAPGGWQTKPFQIVGQDDTCGNKSLISHNSNPSAVVLDSGVVVLACKVIEIQSY